MNKHLNSVPAVAVVFIDLEWDAAEWNERKMECSARVQAVKGVNSYNKNVIPLASRICHHILTLKGGSTTNFFQLNFHRTYLILEG